MATLIRRFSIYTKGGNLCDFMLTAHEAPSEKGSTLKGTNMSPNGSNMFPKGEYSFLSEIPFEKGGKIVLTELPSLEVSILLKWTMKVLIRLDRCAC